jgi:hypothetical protein
MKSNIVKLEWVQGNLAKVVSVGRVVELRGYRAATGSSQIVATVEFANMGDWAAWHSHETIQQILVEMRTVAINLTSELWGPSPMTPEPVRPGG